MNYVHFKKFVDHHVSGTALIVRYVGKKRKNVAHVTLSRAPVGPEY